MTKNNYILSKEKFFNICMKGDGWTSEFILKKIQHIRKVLKSQGKKAQAFNTRGLFSMMLPNDFNYESNNDGCENEPVLKVYKGVYISGALNKKILGAKSGSFTHLLSKEYGDEIALGFINNVQFIVNAWLLYHGFSIGIEDCLATKHKEIEEGVQSSLFKAEGIKSTIHNPGIKEMKINAALCNARDTGLMIAKDALNPDNGFISTVKSGSKGDFFNIAQITGLLGQQNIHGQRIKTNIRAEEEITEGTTPNNKKRTLPHYSVENLTLEDDYESKGFINHSFIHGLNPREFFMHARSGREGVIDTAMKTATTGYMQRRCAKMGEDLKVCYDGTIRNSVGTIYQEIYAEDGMDRSKMVRVDNKLQILDVGRLCGRLNSKYEK